MNNVTLAGYVGKAPEVVSFGDTGNKVAKFSLAIKEYSSKSEVEETMWVNIDAWNGLADRVMKCITAGREVVIVGRLAISEYNKEINGVAVKMQRPVIKLTSFHLCGKKPAVEGETAAPVKTATRKRKLATAS